LRYVIDGLQRSCLQSFTPNSLKPKLGKPESETSVVHQIFGGYLRSVVTCAACNFDSNTIDPFLDLSLEIKDCSSLQQALARYTAVEVLDSKNQYKCDRCKKLSRARKRLMVYKPPAVLTIQLKRFSFSMYGGKINRHIGFEENLNMKQICASPHDIKYSLYAVLVHQGDSTHSGHYYSFVKANDRWFEMNDSQVRPVSGHDVLRQKAYILFYQRCEQTEPIIFGKKNSVETLSFNKQTQCTPELGKKKLNRADNDTEKLSLSSITPSFSPLRGGSSFTTSPSPNTSTKKRKRSPDTKHMKKKKKMELIFLRRREMLKSSYSRKQ